MNVLYYSSAVSGSGHIVQGVSIFNALKRQGGDVSFLILHNSAMGQLAERLDVPQRRIVFEDEHTLSPESYRRSELFNAITDFKPDLILVDLSWFMLQAFIDELSCKKIFLCRQIDVQTFHIFLDGRTIVFDPSSYDIIVKTEPWDAPFEAKEVNPLIIRNQNEIFSRAESLRKLGLAGVKPVCLFAFNGNPGDYKRIGKTYSYLEDEGYDLVCTTNYNGEGRVDLFPVVDYFNAVDLLICGAGYNAFWEAVYFQKEAVFVPIPTRFEDQYRRIEESCDHQFDENGADQLVDIMLQS